MPKTPFSFRHLGLVLLPLALLMPDWCCAQTGPGPSFDCAKAAAPYELLICRDPALAAKERRMADTYRVVLQRLPSGQIAAFRREHFEWFKEYKSACNSPNMIDAGRASCISFYLSEHTQALEKRLEAVSTQPTSPLPSGSKFLTQLSELGTKASVLEEIKADMNRPEAIIGYVELDFKRKIVFTNRRIVSVSSIPLVGMSSEWDKNGGIIFQGGNFQIPDSRLAAISFALSRVRKSEGALGVPKEITDLMNKYGPEISKAVWPFELQLVSSTSEVINRFYGIKGPQAEEIAKLAKSAGLRVFLAKTSE